MTAAPTLCPVPRAHLPVTDDVHDEQTRTLERIGALVATWLATVADAAAALLPALLTQWWTFFERETDWAAKLQHTADVLASWADAADGARCDGSVQPAKVSRCVSRFSPAV